MYRTIVYTHVYEYVLGYRVVALGPEASGERQARRETERDAKSRNSQSPMRNGRPSQLLLISSNGLGRKEVCARLWRRNNRSQVGLDVHWDLVSSKAVRPSWQSPKKVKAGER